MTYFVSAGDITGNMPEQLAKSLVATAVRGIVRLLHKQDQGTQQNELGH